MVCFRVVVMLIALLMVLSCGYCADRSAGSLPAYEMGQPVPQARIAVMSLNVSGDYSDQVREWLPALIEEKLMTEGWTLVVRGQRMDHIQQEHGLPGIKPDTRLPENELLSATTFLELNARIQVKDIQGILGYKIFSLGDYARASVDLNGQIVDPSTGVLKSSVSVGGSAGTLKTAATITIASNWRIAAGGYNLNDIKSSLVGKAADVAAKKLLDKLRCLYGPAPRQLVTGPSSMVIRAEPAPTYAASAKPTVMIELPEGDKARCGDRYGVYRKDALIAELEVIKMTGRRAEAAIISQTDPIKPDDIARKMPVAVKGQ